MNKEENKKPYNPRYQNLFIQFSIDWRKSDTTSIYSFIINKQDNVDNVCFSISRIHYDMSSSANYFDFKPDILQINKNKDNSDIRFKDMCDYIRATLTNLTFGGNTENDKINWQIQGCDVIKVIIFNVTDGNTFEFKLYRKGFTINRPKKLLCISMTEKITNNVDYIKIFCDNFLVDYFDSSTNFSDVIYKYKGIFPEAK